VPFSYWVSEHLFWQLLSAAVVTLLATAALFALIRWAFGLLRQSRQQITFLIASPIFLFVIFGGVLTTIAYLQPRPNFKTYIRMASTVGKTDLDIKSPVVLVVSIANIFVIGGGYEWQFAQRWTVRGEYLFYDFVGTNTNNLTLPDCNLGTPGACNARPARTTLVSAASASTTSSEEACLRAG
jgi:hypothetical protein